MDCPSQGAGPRALELRGYQRECVEAVERAGDGRHLVVMATGLGKTVTFAALPRRGRTLILSHRDELVRQPERYFDCPFGVEKAGERSHGEEVVSASVQTLSREARLSRFKPGDFDVVITDEAHHAVAETYRRVVDRLEPRVHLGFTATPNRNDKVGLKAVFDDIVFSRDMKWGIEHGYLADIDCMAAPSTGTRPPSGAARATSPCASSTRRSTPSRPTGRWPRRSGTSPWARPSSSRRAWRTPGS